jgi:hypothetical protein
MAWTGETPMFLGGGNQPLLNVVLESRARNSLLHCAQGTAEMPVYRMLIGLPVFGATFFAVLSQAIGEIPAAPVAFSVQAEALPFPPDAREVEFDATFDDIEYRSASPMSALAAYYRAEMAKRGWTLEDESVVVEDDSVEMTFFHDGYQVDLDLDERSDDVAVTIECEGLDFSNSGDPEKLAAAGVPQPRAYLFLQKELPRPEMVDGESYRSDACHFKSPQQLQTAFDFYVQALKQSGWRETRRPIVTGDRRYTEFKKGRIEVGVNVFSDAVGSRIILDYENEAKEPVVPPLPPVDATPGSGMIAGEAGAPLEQAAKVAVDVSKNSGSATVVLGAKKIVLQYAAAYRTKHDGETKTRLLFCERAIPLQKMQTLLAKEGDLSVSDLFEFNYPENLILEVSDRVNFSFNAGGVGIGDSIDEPVSDLKVDGNRVAGTLKMPEPKEFFDESFQITASIDAGVITPDTTLGGAPTQAAIAPRQSPFANSELLLPEGCGNISSEGTQYSKSTHAKVGLDPAAIAAFYRRELLAKGWREESVAATATAASPLALRFKQAAASMSVKIEGDRDRSVVDVLLLDDAKAKADGMLPEPGKGRIVLVNGHTQDVVIMIGKQRYPLKAGQGTTNPKSALNYTVAPGKYDLQIIASGQAPQAESLEIPAGTT